MLFIRRKSKSKFKELAYPHLQFFYNVAMKYTGNRFDAEDIVQETYLIAFDKFHQLKDDTKCKSWMYMILRHIYLKSFTQKNYKKEKLASEFPLYMEILEQTADDTDTEQLLTGVKEAAILKKTITGLPEKYNSVLSLYYMDEMSYKEISSMLEIPIGTVMSRLARARGYLKKELLKQMKKIDKSGSIIDIKVKQNRG